MGHDLARQKGSKILEGHLLSDHVHVLISNCLRGKKQALLEEIRETEATLKELKECRGNTPKHVLFANLPPEDRLRQLGMKSEYFIDAIKRIANRVEMAMANILRRSMRHQDEARSLLRSLYATEADLLPDYAKRYTHCAPASASQ